MVERNLVLAVVLCAWSVASAEPLTCGLVNLGNTCFMNATLQAMVHVPEFVAKVSAEGKSRSVQAALLDMVFAGMKSHGQGAYSPDDFVEHVVRATRSFDGFELNKTKNQEDAHEFLNKLFNQIYPQGPVGTPFAFQTTKVTICPDHHSSKLQETNFMLELGWEDGIPGVLSMQDLVQAYFAQECLPEDFRCPIDQKIFRLPVCISATRSINNAPQYLMVQLKRTKYNVVTGVSYKDKRPIHIPALGLQLASPDNKYDLIAMVIHRGDNFNSGHYYTFARSLEKNADHAWYCYDDGADPVKISEKAIKTWLQPESVGSATPYLLVYKQRLGEKAPVLSYEDGKFDGHAYIPDAMQVALANVTTKALALLRLRLLTLARKVGSNL